MSSVVGGVNNVHYVRVRALLDGRDDDGRRWRGECAERRVNPCAHKTPLYDALCVRAYVRVCPLVLLC